MSPKSKSQPPWVIIAVAIIGILGPAIVCGVPVVARLLDIYLPLTTPVPSSPQPTGTYVEFEVRSEKSWQDTGIFVPGGGVLIIEQVAGQWSECASYGCPYRDANGNPGSSPDQDNNLVPGCLHASLVAQIAGRQFCVGTSYTGQIKQSGYLQLRINDNQIGDNEGAIVVHIAVK